MSKDVLINIRRHLIGALKHIETLLGIEKQEIKPRYNNWCPKCGEEILYCKCDKKI